MKTEGWAFWYRKPLASHLRALKQLHEAVGARSLP
jgi:hypothetical protein